MKMQDDIEPYVPRAPKHHALFGEGYVRNHFFIDSKWTPSSRVAQYRCMVDVLEKHKAFNFAQGVGNRRKQAKALNSLKKECSDGRTKLKTALYGDAQRIRNLLRKHKELRRLYQNMPIQMIAENINQRTFVKRKELDRLTYKKNQMSKKYEGTLLELSKLQDRIKYQNEFTLPEEVVAKEFHMELKNSQTRLRALKTVTRAYSTIRHALYQDAIYYGPALSSLQDDINEQANFIKQVIHLGRPALGKIANLVTEYDILEEQTRKTMQERLLTLLAARQKSASSGSELKKLVRKDSDFEIFPNRYDRETPSMTSLKKNLEDIEKVMKQVKQVTLCARAREVYPRMKKQIRDNEQLEKKVERKQLEKDFVQDKDKRAELLIESLKYNVTEESNARKDRIKELHELILEQKKSHDDMVKHTKERGEVMCYLQYSIYQIVDGLRHVSESLGTTRREYPNADLRLPLLQFSAYTPKAFPPSPFEKNPEKLLRGIKDRVQLLMNVYRQKKNDQEIIEANKEYHKSYLRSLLLVAAPEEKSMEALPLIEEEERGDPSVPTRKQIKAMSEKIVEEKMKQED